MILEIALIVLLAASVAVVMLKDLLHAVVVMAGADAVLALIFFIIGAPDIAMTQAAVTAGLTTVIFVIAIGRTRRMEA
jgi:energy-converting hydrogenase B subunit D